MISLSAKLSPQASVWAATSCWYNAAHNPANDSTSPRAATPGCSAISSSPPPGELRKVATVYAGAQFEITDAGLVVKPSPPHIARKDAP